MGNGRKRPRGWKPTTDGAKIFQMWNSFYGSVLLAWLTQVLPGKNKMQLWLPSICNLTKPILLKFYILFSLRKCLDIWDLQLFLKAGLHSRWECFWNA